MSRATFIGALGTALLLVACSAEHDELQQWMDQQRREVKPNVPPLQPPKKFEQQPYASADAVEKKKKKKLAVAMKRDEREARGDATLEALLRRNPLLVTDLEAC